MGATFCLPDLGEGLHEAEVVAWHVGLGDRVVAGQPLCSVETDKAIIEVPSPRSGRIAEILAEAGELIAVGDPMLSFEEGDAVQPSESQGSVLDLPEAAGPERKPERVRARAAPAVRRLADKLGVDLGAVRGSGPGGAIVVADVAAAAAPAAGRDRKLRGVRRAMRINMERAGRTAVAATVTDEADIDSWPDEADVTVRLIRAIVAGCRASPSLNAWFDAEAEAMRLHTEVHIAIAVETDEGLFAPVIRNADALGAEELRQCLDAIKAHAAERSMPPDMLKGSTFTLSNFGTFGGRFASLVVVPPQVAILGAGRARMQIVAKDGAPCARRLLPLSLSFDHRVVTGIEALRFLNAVIDDLQRSD